MPQKLLSLLNKGRPADSGYRIESKGDEATIYLYDAIGEWYGVGAKQFVRDLNALNASTIHLRINSPGGDVFEARTIATAIQQHKAKVVAHIDGLAASAATYIALAADEVEISQGGFFMIHNAWTLAIGNADELKGMIVLLEKIDASIATDYVRKTGQSEEQVVAWMNAETWFSADEAKQYGFVDRIFEGQKAANKWSLSAYSNVPKALTEEQPEPVFDRAMAERRLALLERLG